MRFKISCSKVCQNAFLSFKVHVNNYIITPIQICQKWFGLFWYWGRIQAFKNKRNDNFSNSLNEFVLLRSVNLEALKIYIVRNSCASSVSRNLAAKTQLWSNLRKMFSRISCISCKIFYAVISVNVNLYFCKMSLDVEWILKSNVYHT